MKMDHPAEDHTVLLIQTIRNTLFGPTRGWIDIGGQEFAIRAGQTDGKLALIHEKEVEDELFSTEYIIEVKVADTVVFPRNLP